MIQFPDILIPENVASVKTFVDDALTTWYTDNVHNLWQHRFYKLMFSYYWLETLYCKGLQEYQMLHMTAISLFSISLLIVNKTWLIRVVFGGFFQLKKTSSRSFYWAFYNFLYRLISLFSFENCLWPKTKRAGNRKTHWNVLVKHSVS